MSKLALAQKAGVDQRTVTFIEEGVNIPSLTTLFSICQGLEINVATIVRLAAKETCPAPPSSDES